MQIGILVHLFGEQRGEGHFITDRALFGLRVCGHVKLRFDLRRQLARIYDTEGHEGTPAASAQAVCRCVFLGVERQRSSRRDGHHQALFAPVISLIWIPFAGGAACAKAALVKLM